MDDKQNVHLIYKNVGETPLECMERWRKEHSELDGQPLTYAGRLDPMAEGLIIVLSGEGVHEKDSYADLPKTYIFEILWGASTDTLDVLGLLESTDTHVPSEEDVEQAMHESVGKLEQEYPAFSSKPVGGKPLFMWAREGRIDEIDIPSHSVEIHDATFVSRRRIARNDLLQTVTERVRAVKGDFRQEEILSLWNIKAVEEEYAVDAISVVVSSGFYVRQFVKDLAQKLGAHGIAFSIKRTSIGSYQLP